MGRTRIGEDLLNHNTAARIELVAVAHVFGNICELGFEHGPATQLAFRLEQAGNLQGTFALA